MDSGLGFKNAPRAELEQMFGEMDTDGNGDVGTLEIEAWVAQPDFDSAAAEVFIFTSDTNKDKSLQLDEFLEQNAPAPEEDEGEDGPAASA